MWSTGTPSSTRMNAQQASTCIRASHEHQVNPSPSNSRNFPSHEKAGADVHIASIRRYPVKSVLGESLDTANVGYAGLAGDRRYALQDVETGTIAAAKNPKKWAKLLTMHASYLEE